MKVIKLSATSAADGTAAVTLPNIELGYVKKIVYIVSNGDTPAIVITAMELPSTYLRTVLSVATLAKNNQVFYPMNSASSAADTTISASYCKTMVNGTFKLTMTAGGDSKTYDFYIYLEDDKKHHTQNSDERGSF
jgi:hypothetical protein